MPADPVNDARRQLRLYFEHKYIIAGEEVVIGVLNSAWDSQIHEQSGTLIMPVTVLQNHLVKHNPASIVLTAIHHPYGWYQPNNARALKELLESSSNVIFTGHEHVAESYTKTGSVGEHNEYIESGPLQENGSGARAAFQDLKKDPVRGIIHEGLLTYRSRRSPHGLYADHGGLTVRFRRFPGRCSHRSADR